MRTLLVGLVLALTFPALCAPPAKAKAGRREAIDALSQAQTLEEQGNTEGAISAYARSIELAPSAAAYYQLGRLYLSTGDKKNARMYLSQALELNPDYELAKIELAKIDGGRADVAMNVDRIQNEYQTLHSIRQPAVADEIAIPNSYPTGQSNTGKLRRFFPFASQIPGAGDAPGVPRAAVQPTAPGTAKKNLEPPAPLLVENEGPMRLLSPHEGEQRVAEQRIAATPLPPPERTLTEPDARISPQFAEVQNPEPKVRVAQEGGTGGATDQAPAPGGMPTAEEINRAAFWPQGTGAEEFDGLWHGRQGGVEHIRLPPRPRRHIPRGRSLR